MSTNEPTDALRGTTINGAHRYVLGPVTIDTRTNTITVAENVTANDAALAFIARLVELGWITTPPADMGDVEPTDAEVIADTVRVHPAGEDVREADVIHLSDPEAGYSYCLEPVTLIEAEGDDRPICQTCHRGAMKSVRSGWCPCVTGRPQDCSPEKWPLSRRHGIGLTHIDRKAQP